MLEIDASPMPLHQQVGMAIRRAIADGEARAGERLVEIIEQMPMEVP